MRLIQILLLLLLIQLMKIVMVQIIIIQKIQQKVRTNLLKKIIDFFDLTQVFILKILRHSINMYFNVPKYTHTILTQFILNICT